MTLAQKGVCDEGDVIVVRKQSKIIYSSCDPAAPISDKNMNYTNFFKKEVRMQIGRYFASRLFFNIFIGDMYRNESNIFG